MAHEDKVEQLVFAIRDLNQKVRPIATTTPGGADGQDKELHAILANWRGREQLASRTLKLMTLGEADAAGIDDVVFADADQLSSRVLMSEISTAREAILATVRDLSSSEWDEPHDTADGSKTVVNLVDELIDSDKDYLTKLNVVSVGEA